MIIVINGFICTYLASFPEDTLKIIVEVCFQILFLKESSEVLGTLFYRRGAMDWKDLKIYK